MPHFVLKCSPMKNRKLTSFALLLLLGFIWGTGYSIARFATTNGVSPLGYSFWQSLGPAILIGLLTLRQQKTSATFSVSHARYYLICGLTGIVIPNTNMYLAAPHLPAGLLAVIVNTVPIIAYPMALLARAESFNGLRLAGVSSAVLGLMLIVFSSNPLTLSQLNAWAFMALITPFSFAFCGVYIARFRPPGNSLSLAAGTLFASTLLLLPLVLVSKDFYLLHWPLTLPDAIILLEIVLSSMGYLLLFQLIDTAGAVYYSLVDTIVAITGLLWGYLIFQEKLTLGTAPAILLIWIGLLLVTKNRQAMIKSPATSLT